MDADVGCATGTAAGAAAEAEVGVGAGDEPAVMSSDMDANYLLLPLSQGAGAS